MEARRRETRTFWNSSEIETENSETAKSGFEESSVEEACRVALGSVLAKAREDGGLTREREKMLEYDGETLPGRLSQANGDMGFVDHELNCGNEKRPLSPRTERCRRKPCVENFLYILFSPVAFSHLSSVFFFCLHNTQFLL